MLFDKKIKYLDYYENGVRIKGCGFVKLQVYNGTLKMDVNVRGLHPTDSFVRDVTASDLENDFLLGQIIFKEGSGEFHYTCSVDPDEAAGEAGCRSWKRLVITAGNGRELRCMLDNDADNGGAKKTETRPEGLAEVAENKILEAGAEVVTSEGLSEVGENKVLEAVAEVVTSEVLAEVAENKVLEAGTTQARHPEKTGGDTSARGASGENKPAVESREGAIKILEDKWKQLYAIYPHISPFHDEREYLSLSPSDFVIFPESYYRAANNSFLLHGFYNYKHLILAQVMKRGEARYYLGVPGNYYDREKQVAVMFGFESFECAGEPAKTGDFGYYLMRVEL